MDFHQPRLREISVHGGSHLIDVHGCPWVSMGVHGIPCPWSALYPPMSMDAHGCLWKFTEVHGCPWKSMEVHRCSWMLMEVYRCPWMPMDAHQCPSVSSSLPKKASGSTLFWVGPSASSQPGMSLWQLYGLWAIL